MTSRHALLLPVTLAALWASGCGGSADEPAAAAAKATPAAVERIDPDKDPHSLTCGDLADKVASAEVSPQLAERNKAILAALRRTQGAYTDLATAARREKQAAYRQAGAEVSAGEKALQRALARLDSSGG